MCVLVQDQPRRLLLQDTYTVLKHGIDDGLVHDLGFIHFLDLGLDDLASESGDWCGGLEKTA